MYCHGPIGTTTELERLNKLCPLLRACFKRGSIVAGDF